MAVVPIIAPLERALFDFKNQNTTGPGCIYRVIVLDREVKNRLRGSVIVEE
jgi:hypothetical protein